MLLAVLYILILALRNSKFIWIVCQFLFTRLVTCHLLANYQLPIINYQLSITNYQGCASFNPKLLYISPLSQIALVADTIRYYLPLIMGVTPQAVNTLISPITSRLRGCLWIKVKAPGAHRPRKHPVFHTHTQTLQTGSKLFTKP
ncbi:hypothetical protein E5S67_02321 [Microcoleus sp. IPMA8]|uniref:Secreted protein n=1 Tax=Microcoleus asticus IPMA8 TaxID=2563858 RepID=A0ABX2CW90_9CYAN|nr:hypothetical protein [Microcoleus asticus IPMA8]